LALCSFTVSLIEDITILSEVIETELQVALNIPAEYDFQDTFKKWMKRWEWCICMEGGYYEVDGGQ
jgi:hypothetical protein